MPFKIVAEKEWKAMGFSTDISTVHFGDTKLVNKIKKNNRKISLAIWVF